MQALRILREMGDLSGEADVLNHLGALVSRQGRVDEAVTYYEQALALYNAAGMQEEANMVRTSLARLRAPDGR